MKASAVAPSNIAFTKYWGRKDEKLRIPENGSISMCLSGLQTTTTVEFSDKFKKDDITINDKKDDSAVKRVIAHLNRIRNLAGTKQKAKVASKNNFPSSTGLSSSASGFAALTVAAASAAGLKLPEKQLSILARLGSGSACRSIPSGFVEWSNGTTSDTSYGKQIFKSDQFKIADIVAVVNTHKKDVSTTTGQQTATSSPFLKTRLQKMPKKNIINGALKTYPYISL
ncbi:diphosphomevalonate decarboxylase [Candidatus Curtissbacteria bacterium]|nr:diphosphomevalonate decarboxylase [Candidatus Curtissbacteria bacterium]